MRVFVFLCLLIGVRAGYDEISDYWDTSNDGVIDDTQGKIIMYRDGRNLTYLRTLSTNNTAREFLRKKGKKKKKAKERETLDTFDNVLHEYAEKLTAAEAKQCVDGKMKTFDCYECVCAGGQLYICSSVKCPYMDGTLFKKGKGAKNSNKLAAYIYQEVNCIEGQTIMTSTCNKCLCRDGQVFCNTLECYNFKPRTRQNLQKLEYSSPADSDEESIYSRECKDGQPIPSPDNCNKCLCIDGQVLCTILVCGPIVATDYRHCPPKKWHSLDSHSQCKECYCIDGQLSFCYLDYCSTKVETLIDDNNEDSDLQEYAMKFRVSLPVASATCSPGQTRHDACTYCECNALKRWRCRSEAKTHSTKCKGPVQAICVPGQYFTISTADTCQGCHCSSERKWKCWSVLGACSSFNDHQCPPGDLVKNKLSPCSICYCGIDGTNMCTTDENCARNILNKKKKKQKSCDSIQCVNKCVKKHKKKFGICLKDGCKCVKKN